MINTLLSSLFTNKSKKKISNSKNNSRKNLTKNLINTCNKILVSKEPTCQCFDTNKNPSNNINKCITKKKSKQCKNYNVCKKFYSKFMSGSEPSYNPDNWGDPLIEKSHNCYAYFLDDKIPKVKNKCLHMCKNNGYNNNNCKRDKNAVSACSNLKPQPGNYAHEHKINNFKRNRIYSCDKMNEKILIDSYNPKIKKSNIFKTPFNKACPKNFYKGGLTIQKGKTYHFYRQDKNGRYSHKQGTLRVENVDASKKPIYAPHLSDLNYNKQNNKDGISYDEWCGYYCIPRNYHADTHAAGGIKN
jgi:hypothetical protein